MLVNAMEVSGIEGNFRSTCESVMRVLRENRDSVMAMLEAFIHDPLINWRLAGATSSSSSSGSNNTTFVQDMETTRKPKISIEEVNPRPSHPVPLLHSPRASVSPRRRMTTVVLGKSDRSRSYDADDTEDTSKRPPSLRPRAATEGVIPIEAVLGKEQQQRRKSVPPDSRTVPRPEPTAELNARALAVVRRVREKLTGREHGQESMPIPQQVDLLIDMAMSPERLSVSYIGWCAFW